MTAEGWSLGDELVALLRRWHLLAAAALLGGLAGWLIALALPPVHEAEADLSVSFTADAFYLAPDDYKHQQLAELEALALSEPVLADTARRLGPGFDLPAAELRGILDPRWRNAGAWQLTAAAAAPDEAAEIASAWREALLAAAGDALSHAAAFNELDRRLTAQARALAQSEADLAALRLVLRDVETWLADPDAESGDEAAASLARRAAVLLGPAGLEPETGLQAIAAALAAEITVREDLYAGLAAGYDALGEDWLAEQRLAHGLSAYLVVEMPEDRSIRTERVYTPAPLSLAGAALGLLGFAGYRLAAVTVRKDRADRPG